VLDRVDYHKPRRPRRGIGIAVAIKSAGAAHRSDATIRIRSGSAVVETGVTEIGQSTRTVMSQIAAEVLRVDLSCVDVADIDTGATPFDSGTHASCGLTVSGLAVREAAEKARDAVLEFAAAKIGCNRAGLDFEGFKVMHGAGCYSLADLLDRSGLADDTEFCGTASRQTGGAPLFWMPSWTAAEVEVDTETGAYRVLRLVTAVDVGKAINPQRCKSQAEGGAVQGFGQAMFEHLSYGSEMPHNAEPLKYRVPRLSDVPAQFDAIVFEQGHGPGPYGAKGVGEAGNLAIPAAIANAIADAVGARVTDLPITADKVLAALVATPLAVGPARRL
jgi:CO/xanthine dehydrogenase Mo-binding subunit